MSGYTNADDDQAELEARRKAGWLAAARREAALARDWTGAGATPYEAESTHPRRIGGSSAVGVRNPAIPGARAFSLESVGPGWTLYSIWEPLDPAGIVVDVMHRQQADEETGEVFPVTTYKCLAYWKPSNPWRYLDAGDVDLTQLGGIDRVTTSEAVRALVKPLVLSRARKRRQKQLTASEIQAVHDASVLARAVAL